MDSILEGNVVKYSFKPKMNGATYMMKWSRRLLTFLLAAVLLAAVGMREVDHHLRVQTGLFQHLACGLDMGRVIVGRDRKSVV